jgi:hypothetical protein
MFALSASSAATRVTARAPASKAQRITAAAAFTPISASASASASSSKAARFSLKPRAQGVAALKASTSSVAAKASPANLSIFAGRFDTDRTYIMIKPDGVQRGYVSARNDTLARRISI